jgi:hypothetical protein
MTWVRSLLPIAACVTLSLSAIGRAEAQVRYGPVPATTDPAAHGSGTSNVRVGPGYQATHGLPQRANLPTILRGPQTVTDYQSLIKAITSIPGWYGPAQAPVEHPQRPQPTVPRDQLLGDDGTIRWPGAAPDDPARRTAEEAVRGVVEEHRKYGQAAVRRVADARNKLTAFARQALPALKARNAADADALERFIVELQKTLATLTIGY